MNIWFCTSVWVFLTNIYLLCNAAEVPPGGTSAAVQVFSHQKYIYCAMLQKSLLEGHLLLCEFFPIKNIYCYCSMLQRSLLGHVSLFPWVYICHECNEHSSSRIIDELDVVGHCFAWHVQVDLDFYFYFKTEELVHSGQCAMHMGHNSIFPSARIKILLWKIDK